MEASESPRQFPEAVRPLKVRYVEDYLEYFEYNLNMQSPSVNGGLSEKNEDEIN